MPIRILLIIVCVTLESAHRLPVLQYFRRSRIAIIYAVLIVLEHLNERLRNQVQLPTLVEHYGAIKNVQRIRAGYAPFVYRRNEY